MNSISKRIRILCFLVMTLAITGGTVAYADTGSSLTETQKNSSYGFFVWLSENADTSSEKQDAAVAAQILTNTVSSTNSEAVFNNGTIIGGSSSITYNDLLSNMQLGAETDATNLDNLRQAIDFISLGNTYRAKENLAPLKVSSGLMAMAELNSDYQDINSVFDHSNVFLVLENLAYRRIGGTWAYGSIDGKSDDPYEGWYTEEKTYFINGDEGSAGHYKTLTDRQGVMLITGFGVRDRFVEKTLTASDGKDYQCNMHDRYYSQTFSNTSSMYDIGTGVTPEKYASYLDTYEHQLNVEYCAAHGHTCTKWTTTNPATCTAQGTKSSTCSVCSETVTESIPATNHDWQAPTYKWSSDYKTVTATRTCANNSEAACTETKTVSTTSRVSKAPTYTTEGQTTYTAAFEGSIFKTQTKTVSNIAKLAKKANPMTVKVVKKTLKVKALKKKAKTIAPITVNNAKGKVTYKCVSGTAKSKKALKLNTKTGKITVKKATKKGTYALKVKVSAAGMVDYKAASKTVTIKVEVK